MVAPVIAALIDPVSRLIDHLIPDPDVAARAKLELLKEENMVMLEQLKLAMQADAGQAAINTAEAQHRSLFVAGWRSFIGWVCGVAFAYHYILQPLLLFGFSAAGNEVKLPDFNLEALVTLLFGMLGLGGLRTFEKVRGVTQ